MLHVISRLKTHLWPVSLSKTQDWPKTNLILRQTKDLSGYRTACERLLCMCPLERRAVIGTQIWLLTTHYKNHTSPLPHIHTLPDTSKDMTVFSKFILVKAHNQIHMAAQDIPKTPMITSFDDVSQFEICQSNFLEIHRWHIQRSRIRAEYVDDRLITGPDREYHL